MNHRSSPIQPAFRHATTISVPRMTSAGLTPSDPARMKFAFMNTPPNAAIPVSRPTSRPRPTASSPSATSVANRPALGWTTFSRNHRYQPGVPSARHRARDEALDRRAVTEQPLAARHLAPTRGEEHRGDVQAHDQPQPGGRRAREQEPRPARLLELFGRRAVEGSGGPTCRPLLELGPLTSRILEPLGALNRGVACRLGRRLVDERPAVVGGERELLAGDRKRRPG